MAKRRGILSQQQIVEAALVAVDQDGLDNLSMRRLGTALGVEAMSLYNHYPNKDAILNALHQRILSEMPIPGGEGSWVEQVKRAAYAFRDLLRAHPRAIPLMATRAAVNPASLAYFDGGVAIFRKAGLSPNDAVRAFQTVFELVIGHGSFHFARHEEETNDLTTLYGDFPALADVTDYEPESEFEYGLELLIEGLKTRIQPKAKR